MPLSDELKQMLVCRCAVSKFLNCPANRNWNALRADSGFALRMASL